MIVSQTPYNFTDKSVATRCLNSNLDLIPYEGEGFVNTCGNGAYFVIVIRNKKGEHLGYFNF